MTEIALQQPILHEVFSVSATVDSGVYILDVDITDTRGERYRCDYCSRPDDVFGLAPTIRQWLQDNASSYAVIPYEPVAPGSAPYQIAKTTPWRRMTDSEADVMDAVMSETSAKIKQIYMAAAYLSSDDPLWATMHQLLADNLPGGSARADELLAPES